MQAAKIKTKWLHTLKENIPSMEGKVVVITGTTSGTGNICSRACAEKGATVVMLNRKSERSEKALSDIKEAYPDATVLQIECDLQDFSSVQAAADKVKADFAGGIDVLCNNAGIMAMPDLATKDGFDVQMQTNHLSHFLLTKELFPLLELGAEKNGKARIVNHSSVAMYGMSLKEKYFGKNGGNLGGNSASVILNGARWKRYQQTKKANAVFTMALRDRLAKKNSKVIACCAHPGLAATNLQVNTNKHGGMGALLNKIIFKLAGQSAEDGSCGLFSCIALPEVKNGDYWAPRGFPLLRGWGTYGPAKLMPFVKQINPPKNKADQMWEWSEKAVGGQFEL